MKNKCALCGKKHRISGPAYYIINKTMIPNIACAKEIFPSSVDLLIAYGNKLNLEYEYGNVAYCDKYDVYVPIPVVVVASKADDLSNYKIEF